MYENENANQQNTPFGQPQTNVQQPQFGNTPQQGTPPKTWLVESILATIFCCLPFGIIGIINASKVESKFYAGDVQGSLKASEDAKKWSKIALICGIVVGLIYAALMLFGVMGGIMGSR